MGPDQFRRGKIVDKPNFTGFIENLQKTPETLLYNTHITSLSQYYGSMNYRRFQIRLPYT